MKLKILVFSTVLAAFLAIYSVAENGDAFTSEERAGQTISCVESCVPAETILDRAPGDVNITFFHKA